MTDLFEVTPCDDLVSQEPEGPARMPLGWFAASQQGQLGFDLAGQFRLGPRPAFVVQRPCQPTLDIALTNVTYGALAAHHSCGNFLVRALLTLTTVTQKQDTRSGLFAGRCVAGVDQMFKLGSFVCIQLNLSVFSHACSLLI